MKNEAKHVVLIGIKLTRLDLDNADTTEANIKMEAGVNDVPSAEKLLELLTLASTQLVQKIFSIEVQGLDSVKMDFTLSECPKCREIRYNKSAGKCEECEFTD